VTGKPAEARPKVSLTAFLAARLDEKERRALGTPANKAEAGARTVLPWLNELAPPVPRDEVTLREVAAMRAILERYERGAAGDLPEWKAGRELIEAGVAILLGVLRDLAAVYSDHPDYDPGWKP
jgi:hypothetical protein